MRVNCFFFFYGDIECRLGNKAGLGREGHSARERGAAIGEVDCFQI